MFLDRVPMLPDLERVIALQRLDSATHDAQRRLAEEPERLKAFQKHSMILRDTEVRFG